MREKSGVLIIIMKDPISPKREGRNVMSPDNRHNGGKPFRVSAGSDANEEETLTRTLTRTLATLWTV